jgi:hypothetical protein
MNLIKTNIVNDFLVYVIEEYKYLEDKTAKETMEFFNKFDVLNYISKHYDILHTMGGRAIVDDINLFTANRQFTHT